MQFGGQWYRLREKLDTFLVIGLDKESDRLENLDEEATLNNQQCDFLLLVVADRAEGTFTALQLNRDTMALIPRIGIHGARLSPVTQQLALSHTYGSGGRDSCTNTVHAVSNLLYGIPVEHYFSLTMDAIPVLTDLVDGVPVHVEDDFSQITPDLPQGRDVTLRGDLALTFVRSRGGVGDGSNLNRMNRQRVYLSSLHERLNARLGSDSSFALRLATELADYSISDLLTDELAQAAERMSELSFSGIETIQGEAKMGEKYIEFYPDEEALQAQLIRLFFEPLPS